MSNAIHTLVLALTLGGCLLGGQTAHAAAPKSITLDDAERIALGHVPGGTLESIDRDRHFGRVVYEVEVRATDGREHELVIDAADGRIVSEEIDD